MEFACENCTKPLLVPDGSSGKRCSCPNCGQSQVVPEESLGIEAVVGGAASEQLSIPCPKCRHLLQCSTSLLGTKGLCRVCHHKFVITEDADARARSLEAPSLVFNCPKCDQLFEGREEMRGRKGKCHSCGNVFPIELKLAKTPDALAVSPDNASVIDRLPQAPTSTPPRSTPSWSTDHRDTAEPIVTVEAEAVEEQPIQLACPRCRGTMEVPGSAIGLSTACPYCNTVIAISKDLEVPAAVPQTPVPNPFGNNVGPVGGPSNPFWDQTGPGASQGGVAPQFPMAGVSQRPIYLPAGGTRRRSNLPSGRSPAVYIAPGICLSVVGVMGFVWITYMLINAMTTIMRVLDGTTRYSPAVGIVFLGIFAFIIVATILQILGGISMAMRSSLVMARIGAVIACLPFACLGLSIPFGIWGSIIVCSSQAKRDFS